MHKVYNKMHRIFLFIVWVSIYISIYVYLYGDIMLINNYIIMLFLGLRVFNNLNSIYAGIFFFFKLLD